jgi:SAM-dependent methyltransferase
MKTITERIEINNPSWFKSWFNSSLYHSLYAHRDEKEAAGFIDEIVDELQPLQNSTMLDLGCGNGRHSKYLASKGFRVTGIDLAASSIAMAKKFESSTLKFYRHDMRAPFGNNCFDYVFNFFTSFGYFKNEEENDRVVHNIFSSLKPGGILLLDYINTQYAEERLVPAEEKEIDGIIYHIIRWADNKYFFKEIIAKDIQSEELHIERVAKFEFDDFNYMFNRNGLQIKKVYGDYLLNDYNSKTSPRLIILAKKIIKASAVICS